MRISKILLPHLSELLVEALCWIYNYPNVPLFRSAMLPVFSFDADILDMNTLAGSAMLSRFSLDMDVPDVDTQTTSFYLSAPVQICN